MELQRRWFFVISLLGFMVLLCLVFFEPIRHDYGSYIGQWNLVLAGSDPWKTNNAYGPFHNLFAIFIPIHKKMPCFLFMCSWYFWALFFTSKVFAQAYIPEKVKLFLSLSVLVNPLFLCFIVFFGNNDSIVSVATVLGVWFYFQRKDVASGLLIGSAVLVKFLPVFILPFLVMNREQVRWKLLFVVVSMVAGVFFISWFLWGNSIFHPFVFGSMRVSTNLSIFMFIRHNSFPLNLIFLQHNLDSLSLPLLCLGLVLLFYLHLRYSFSNIFSATLSLVVVLMFYKVGHVQFYMTSIMLVLLWLYFDYQTICENRFCLISTFAYVIYIAVYVMAFAFIFFIVRHHWSSPEWFYLSTYIGLPTFILEVTLVVAMLRYAFTTDWLRVRTGIKSKEGSTLPDDSP